MKEALCVQRLRSDLTDLPVLYEDLYTVPGGPSQASDSCGFVANPKIICLAKLFL